jgi:hypothetical protein
VPGPSRGCPVKIVTDCDCSSRMKKRNLQQLLESQSPEDISFVAEASLRADAKRMQQTTLWLSTASLTRLGRCTLWSTLRFQRCSFLHIMGDDSRAGCSKCKRGITGNSCIQDHCCNNARESVSMVMHAWCSV